MDTLAVETVNYYGIGWDQIHSLNIIHPFDLPFEGILELHTGFYENQVCTFPLTIADTITTSIREVNYRKFEVYPNPTDNELIISHEDIGTINRLQISDLQGQIMYKSNNPVSNTIDVSVLNSGIYIIHIIEKNGHCHQIKFIKS